jgi:nucleotide-binding universal stress UspA family protein
VRELLLVPLDGSEPAEAALAYAELIPSRRVRLLLAEPDDRGPMLSDVIELAEWRREREAGARAYLERVGEPLARQGRSLEIAFAFGDPSAQIVDAAADADLVVMVTSGRGAGGRALFGSVAEGVVRRDARRAPRATLLVRGGARPPGGPPVSRVLVPLDGSAAAERAVPVAAELADDLGVPIHLVRVVAGEAARREAEEALAAAVRRLRDRDLAATGEVRVGAAVPELLATARESDVVAMTTRRRGGVRRWLLGSVADELVRQASAPVLIVRGDAEGAGIDR